MMRVRGQEFCGTSNRWVSGSKDITYQMRPALIAAMEATISSTEATHEDYTAVSDTLVACLNGGLQPGAKVVDLVARCRERLHKCDPTVMRAFFEELSMSLLALHLLGVRELTSSPFPSDEEMRDALCQCATLSALPDEDRSKVINMLKRAGAWRRAELERQAPPGKVVDLDEGTAGEAAKPD